MTFELEPQEPGRFKKPTVEMLELYCKQENILVDCEAFWWHYESKGWKVGKVKMTCWRSAVKGWWTRNGKPRPVEPKLHQAKPDRKLTQDRREAGRQGAEAMRRALKGL